MIVLIQENSNNKPGYLMSLYLLFKIKGKLTINRQMDYSQSNFTNLHKMFLRKSDNRRTDKFYEDYYFRCPNKMFELVKELKTICLFKRHNEKEHKYTKTQKRERERNQES